MKTSFAYDPADEDEVRVEKTTIFLVAGCCCLAGCIWTVMYYYVFGPSTTTLLPALFVLIVGTALLVSHISRNHKYAVYAEIICIIYITTFIQWSIGGVFDSGLVLVWAFLGPLCALMFFSLRQSALWLVLYLSSLVVTVVFNDFFVSHGQAVPESTKMIFFIMNLSFASVVVFVFAGYYVISANTERKNANRLLLNVLPKEIAPILKTSEQTIAEQYDSASVLFADIVGSTPLFADLEAEEAVAWLNEVFSDFDSLVEKYGLEKISTNGDNYMVASGVPIPRPDHAEAISSLALDMVQSLKDGPAKNGKRIEFRLGINSGPLVAGVIGKFKFHYDVWGDTVNTASRMESHGEAGKVHITAATYEMVKDAFVCVSRGPIPVKGKGQMDTYFLVSRREPSLMDGSQQEIRR